MSSNFGFNTNSDVLKYLKKFGKMKKETPLVSIEILKSNLIRSHTQSELSTLRILLKTEIENKKHHNVVETGIIIFSSAITTFFIYLFIFGSDIISNAIIFVVGENFKYKSKNINTDAQFEKEIQETSDVFVETIQELTKIGIDIFWRIFLILVILTLFYWFYYQRNYRHLQFYKNLIDECIAEKEKEENFVD